MTGAHDQGARPADRGPAACRRPDRRARASTTTSSTWQVGFTFQMPLGMRGPLANTRQSQYRPAPAAGLSPADRPPDDPLAGPVLPGSRRQLQAVQDGLPAPGRRRPAARGPAGLLRGRPDHDRPLPRRRQPVCQAVAQEAQYKTTYNISIVALEEAKGTLLAYDNIAVAEGPHPRKAYVQARDNQDGHRSSRSRPTGRCTRQPVNGPGESRPGPVEPAARRPARRSSAAAGPGRPARPAPHPAAADRPGGRAADPLAGTGGPGFGHSCRRRSQGRRLRDARLGDSDPGGGPGGTPAIGAGESRPAAAGADHLPGRQRPALDRSEPGAGRRAPGPARSDQPSSAPEIARRAAADSSIPDRPEAGASPRSTGLSLLDLTRPSRESSDRSNPRLPIRRIVKSLLTIPRRAYHNNDHSAGRSPGPRWRTVGGATLSTDPCREGEP